MASARKSECAVRRVVPEASPAGCDHPGGPRNASATPSTATSRSSPCDSTVSTSVRRGALHEAAISSMHTSAAGGLAAESHRLRPAKGGCIGGLVAAPDRRCMQVAGCSALSRLAARISVLKRLQSNESALKLASYRGIGHRHSPKFQIQPNFRALSGALRSSSEIVSKNLTRLRICR